MLDKIINTHVDKQELIEERIGNDLESALDALKINDLMQSPLDTLLLLVEGLKEHTIEEYAENAIKNGQEFARTVSKLKRSGKDIVVEKSNDPKLNNPEEENAREKEGNKS